MAVPTPDPQAQRLLDLARQIKRLGEKPAEVEGGAHSAAQSALAGMGYELATLFLTSVEEEMAAAQDQSA